MRSVQLVIAFYITFLVYAMVSYFIYEESVTLLKELLLEGVFVLLTVGFCFFDLKGVFSLYRIHTIHWRNLLFSILFPVFTAVAVYYGMDWLDNLLFDEGYNIFYDYIQYDHSFLWAFIFICIVAPVFEELAFRGFLFNQLKHVANTNVTIIATAFIFALVHFSLLSILWIFPFGLVLGYLRHRYNTLWLGMIVHFIHNLIVLLLDYYAFFGFWEVEDYSISVSLDFIYSL
ncbi:CPBP family intramembrane metalloprotease [Flavobacteriaceae bacterium TK19130]|nr:CPBP family intramembrane metalloprotease [Thermobacterium salinum]